MGHNMVLPVWFEVVVVLKAGSVGVTEEQRLEGVAVIDCVQVLAMHELNQVVSDDWVLSNSSVLSSG